jgi:hypothetical protein
VRFFHATHPGPILRVATIRTTIAQTTSECG